jgi:MoxR-like ATPase
MLLEYTGRSRTPALPASSELPTNVPAGSTVRDRDWVYLADSGLVQAVNIALLLEQPLLVTGEPGTGKTQLAYSVASDLNLGDVLRFDTKSNSTYRDLFYQFDSLRSFRDAQNQIKDRTSLDYIGYNALGKAILNANAEDAVGKYIRGFAHSGVPRRSLVLIDEVDKAPRDFPNDILREIEQMYFDVPELEIQFSAEAAFRPVVIITSNSERLLPSAFLRRCIYYHIPFPEQERLKDIVSERLGQHFPRNGRLLDQAITLFYEIRGDNLNLRKRPSTAELLGWVVTLQNRFKTPDSSLASDPSFVLNSLSCVIKDSQDMRDSLAAVRKWLDQIK